jgi:hypothetical protein
LNWSFFDMFVAVSSRCSVAVITPAAALAAASLAASLWH